MYEQYESYDSNPANYSQRSEARVTESEIAAYLAKVMGWMCVGLITTLASAMLCVYFVGIEVLNSFTLIAIIQIAVVVGFASLLKRISAGVATVLFMLYSALTGLTLSVFYFMFELSSIVMMFGLAAMVFFAMAMYGLVTRRDLSRFGSLLFMGLLAVILASVVNIFLRSGTINFIVTVVGLLIFVALTAYDVQKIKAAYVNVRMSEGHYSGAVIEEQTQKLAIFGALQLYLDFINIFIRLLILFGRRR
jgi:FtsH-binding integral membrane protein